MHTFLVHSEFILVWLYKKLLAYRNTLESVLGINQYWAMSVKFLAQWNNGLPLTVIEPMEQAISRLLVRCVNHSTTPPPLSNVIVCSDWPISLAWNDIILYVLSDIKLNYQGIIFHAVITDDDISTKVWNIIFSVMYTCILIIFIVEAS